MIEFLSVLALLFQAGTATPAAPQPDPPAYEGEWVVEVIDNIKTMPESRITLAIRGTTISGTASCNTYSGTMTVSDDRVRVGQLLRTMKACDEARMSEEGDFFAMLQAVTSWRFGPRDTLVLTTREGRTISARRVPPSR